MKQLLAILVLAFTAMSVSMAAEPAKKAPAKKEVKHHKKFDGEKVPDAPAKKAAPAKKK